MCLAEGHNRLDARLGHPQESARLDPPSTPSGSPPRDSNPCLHLEREPERHSVTWRDVCSPSPEGFYVVRQKPPTSARARGYASGSRATSSSSSGAPPSGGLPFDGALQSAPARARLRRPVRDLSLGRSGVEAAASSTDPAASPATPVLIACDLRTRLRIIELGCRAQCLRARGATGRFVARAFCDRLCPYPEGTSPLSRTSDMTCSARGGHRTHGGGRPFGGLTFPDNPGYGVRAVFDFFDQLPGDIHPLILSTEECRQPAHGGGPVSPASMDPPTSGGSVIRSAQRRADHRHLCRPYLRAWASDRRYATGVCGQDQQRWRCSGASACPADRATRFHSRRARWTLVYGRGRRRPPAVWCRAFS